MNTCKYVFKRGLRRDETCNKNCCQEFCYEHMPGIRKMKNKKYEDYRKIYYIDRHISTYKPRPKKKIISNDNE